MKKHLGFTLLELMIVVTIIAIIAAIAYPAYNSQVRKSRRSEARQALADMALRQEKYRSYNATYATCDAAYGGAVNACTSANNALSFYTVAVTVANATGFTATAAPKTGTDQVKDSCGTLTYTLSSTAVSKTPTDCW